MRVSPVPQLKPRIVKPVPGDDRGGVSDHLQRLEVMLIDGVICGRGGGLDPRLNLGVGRDAGLTRDGHRGI
jgi:hypothetical protein